jgi:hypothetical protein
LIQAIAPLHRSRGGKRQLARRLEREFGRHPAGELQRLAYIVPGSLLVNAKVDDAPLL